MKTNVAVMVKTHEGATAFVGNAEQQLRRSVLACMLWEDGFYEDGQSIGERIASLVPKVGFEAVAAIAIEAREEQKLRHAPLLLLRECVKHFDGKKVGDLVARVIQRPDEMGELISLYWAGDGNKKMIPRQMKIGIARAFKKFNEYQLAKWDNNSAAVKLRDVVFLCHIRAGEDKALGSRIARLVNKATIPQDVAARYEVNAVGLASAETWENRLSRGEDKKAVFTELLAEGKLGALALLRNLRGMSEAGVEDAAIRDGLNKVNAERVLPFRFITAARHNPKFEPELDALMMRCLAGFEKFPGKTVVIVDVSGSMYGSPVSAKSEVDRATAACAVAAMLREVCEVPLIYATAGSDSARVHKTALVPARRGMALVAAIHGMCGPLGGGGIFLRQVMDFVHEKEGAVDRVIVITDEQDCGIASGDSPANAKIIGKQNYIINVASVKNGIAREKWEHINGWSESVVSYIQQLEAR